MGNICTPKTVQEVHSTEFSLQEVEKKLGFFLNESTELLDSMPETPTETTVENWLHSLNFGKEAIGKILSLLRPLPQSEIKAYLQTLGILLSKGTTHLKICLLYHAFNESSFMGPSETKRMLATIARVSSDLAVLTPERDSTYTAKLQQGIERFVLIKNARFHKTGTLLYTQDFCKRFTAFKYLLVPAHVRRELFKCGKETLPMFVDGVHSIESANEFQYPHCPSGHELKWTNCFPSSVNYTHHCYECHELFTCPSWYCEQCKLHLCEECSAFKSPKLTCMEGHVLLFRPDVTQYYTSLYKDPYFNCELCRGHFNEGAWHCRLCKYDVCAACAEEYGYSVFTDILQCTAHKVTPKNECRYCNKPKGKCETCGCCTECFEFQSWPSFGHRGLQCVHGHTLRWMLSATTCVCCGTMESGYCCLPCNIHLCVGCAVTVLDFLYSPEPGLFHWRPQKPSRACSICLTHSEHMGGLESVNGREFYCIVCMHKPS